MGKQFIITISREYGSGGHDIGTFLANQLGIKMYDRSLIREIALEMNMEEEELKKYDEKPKNRILTRSVGVHSNSMEDILDEKQAEFIQRKADMGESFIVVGRRGKEILDGNPGLISIFVTADEDYKIKRIMDDLAVDETTAKATKDRVNHLRKVYHNRHSDQKWGDSRYYDFIINSARLGAMGTAMEVLHYVKARIKAMEESSAAEETAEEGAAEAEKKIFTEETVEIEVEETDVLIDVSRPDTEDGKPEE